MSSFTRRLARRSWVSEASENRVDEICSALPHDTASILDAIEGLITHNTQIHDIDAVNLNPATNTMSQRATSALRSNLSSRTSLGYAGDKYEMGLEAIEQIEVVAAELAASIFNSDHAEIRVPSGTMANLYAFMATTKPGDSIIVPPSSIAGHVTHHSPGAAGLYGLDIHEAPIDATNYTIDVEALASLAERVQPRLITVGASLNLTHHNVAGIREAADLNGAHVLFDAAHLSGPIAGGAWPNPLDQGAHLMTMSTYKSLGGPTAGLVATNDAELAERIDHIAFPGLTANFDVGKTAALAVTLAEWLTDGARRAQAMIECAQRLAAELVSLGVAVHHCGEIATQSHAFALDARQTGGGSATALHLRRANILASAIGLPTGGNDGVRIGTNELIRLGATANDMPGLADLIAQALASSTPEDLARTVTHWRSKHLETAVPR